MSGLIIAGIVAAVILVALALQVLARQIQRLPLDQRRADPLIDISSVASGTMRPAELHQLTTIVANATLSDASYHSELVPLLDQLDRDRTGPGSPGGPSGRRPGGRGRRSERIDAAITELEAAWDPAPGRRDLGHAQSKG